MNALLDVLQAVLFWFLGLGLLGILLWLTGDYARHKKKIDQDQELYEQEMKQQQIENEKELLERKHQRQVDQPFDPWK